MIPAPTLLIFFIFHYYCYIIITITTIIVASVLVVFVFQPKLISQIRNNIIQIVNVHIH